MFSQMVKSAPKLTGLTKMARADLQTWHQLKQTHGRIIGQSEPVWNRSARASLQALVYVSKRRLFRFFQKPPCFGSDQHYKIVHFIK